MRFIWEGPGRVLRFGVSLLVVGLLAAGCSSAGAPTPQVVYVTPTPADTLPVDEPASGVSGSCRDEVGPFADALMELDSRLNVGLNFDEYSDLVANARVAYDRIAITGLDAACLAAVAAPAEGAYNNYLYAYRIWNACMDKLSCTMASIDSKLQGYWAKATDLIDRFREEMR